MTPSQSEIRILVVDDEPGMRDFLAGFCEINGYDAELAESGAEALNLIRNNGTYDLAIVDFLMPQMHGADFIRKIRGEEMRFPVIAMSAFDDVEKAFKEAGANVFLKKPFDPYTLEEEVKRLTRRYKENAS